MGFSEYLNNQRKLGWLELVNNKDSNSKCLHLQCPRCKGKGIDDGGNVCIHSLSCPCDRCSPKS